jgi:thiamine-phosphate diphosphorylase
VVNDYPDLALAIGAHGVHLGQEDFPLREARALMGGRLIGLSTHSVEEALKAQGADYIGVGPIYHTATKEAGPPRGPGLIREVKAKVGMPVVAIGGIGPENLKDALEAGADAVALSGALLGAEDFLQAVRQLMDTLRQVLEELK